MVWAAGRNRRSVRRRVIGSVLAGGLVAAGLAVGLPAGPVSAAPPAGAANPPAAGRNVIVFPERDFLSAEGYSVDSLVDIEVWRNGAQIGGATGIQPQDDVSTAAFDGIVEVNHPGGACWSFDGVTPDLKSGDAVYVIEHRAGGLGDLVDLTTTADVRITEVATAQGTSGDIIVMKGTARAIGGGPLPAAEIEARLVSSSADPFELNGRRTLRAVAAGVGTADGELTYDGTNWTATWVGLSEADVLRSVASEHRILWLGPSGTEGTIFENGPAVAPGPSAPCTAPLAGPVAQPDVPRVDFPATDVGSTSPAARVRVTNTGRGADAALVVSQIRVSSSEVPVEFAISNDLCTGVPVPVNGSCDFFVTFSPSAAGLRAGNVQIVSNAGNTLVPLTANGVGVTGGATAFPRSLPALLDFGTRTVGNPAPTQTVTITNLGNAPLTITALSTTGPNAADFEVVAGSDCLDGPIGPTEACSAGVIFTPGGQGTRSASLVIVSPSTGTTTQLQGAGLITGGGLVDPPVPPISLGVFAARDFVSVEGYEPGEALTIQIIRSGVVVGVAHDVIAGADGIAEVNHPGGSCWEGVTPNIRAGDTLRVTRPSGEYSQTVTANVFANHAIQTGPDTVEIHGFAKTAAGGPIPIGQLEARIIASSKDRFHLNDRRSLRTGEDGTIAYDPISLVNPDGTRWTATFSGLDAHDVANGVSQETRILWLGRDPLALFEITFWEDGADVANGPSAPCTAPGEPDSPGASLSPDPLLFPDTAVAPGSSTRALTITNTGASPLVVTDVRSSGGDAADFALDGPLPAPIGPGDTGLVTIRFTPSVGGSSARNSTIRVYDNAIGSPHTVSVSGNASGTPVPSFAVAPGALSFGSVDVDDTSSTMSLTVTNEGSGPMQLTEFSILGTDAAQFAIVTSGGSTCATPTPSSPTIVDAGDTCRISLEFSPTSIGAKSASLRIVSNATGAPHSVGLSGSSARVAGVNDPPAAPVLIEVFPVRDFISASGFGATVAAVDVEVERPGLGLIGAARQVVPIGGLVEINHSGAGCWDLLTPDVRPGDIVRMIRFDADGHRIGADQTHVQGIEIILPATQLAPGTVVMHAVVSDVFGGAVPAGALEPRIVSTTTFDINGRKSIRAGSGLDGTVSMAGGLAVATFTGLSPADVARATSGDSAVLWLGRDPLALVEGTMSEFAELPGPDPACAAPAAVPIVELTPAPLSLGTGAIGTASAPQDLVLTNTSATAAVSGVFVNGPVGPHAGDFSITSTTCGANLAPGASCRITVRMTASAAGARWASVGVNHSGSNGSSRAVVTGTAIQPPTISGILPASAGHGATVRISGTNLATASSVRIGGVVATFTSVGDSAIDAVVPGTAAVGSAAVLVQAAGGSVSSFLQVTPAAPTVTSVSPGTGGAGDTVTISGSGFTSLQSVRFNGVAATVGSSTATSISVTVPAGATSGLVTVTTAGGSASSPATFTVQSSPVITSFNPTASKTGRSITIAGSGFGPRAQLQVSFNGALGTITAATATSITVTVPNNATQGPVTVTNTAAPARTGSSNGFTVQAAPSIATVGPLAGAPVGGTITITGTNMLGTTKVSVNGRSATNVVVVNATTVTARVPDRATSGRVQVTNSWGSANSPATFTVIQPPTVTALSPTSGANGVLVTVTGTNFATASGVRFGSTELTLTAGAPTAGTYQVVSATQIRLVPPSGSGAGLFSIRVTNPAGSATGTTAFRIT